MPSSLAKIYLGGNNNLLNEEIKKCLKKDNLSVETNKEKETDYRLLIYDLGINEEKTIESYLSDLDSIANFFGKTCVVLVSYSHLDNQQLDKYQSTIQTYLTDRKNNLRLIITQDLYHSGKEENLTDFENKLYQIIQEEKINVTSDGSKRYYPTHIDDLCELIVKSLFITNTAGQTFTALTEEITDLEIAYLLKKSLEKKDISLDINLSDQNKSKTESQMELSIQTQALLNWIPKNNFSDALSDIINRCLTKTKSEAPYEPKIEVRTLKPLLQKLPKIKKEKKNIPKPEIETNLHLKEKRGVIKIIIAAIVIIVFLIIAPVIISLASLYFSTKLTYQSFQEIRIGEVISSKKHLNQAQFFYQFSSTPFQIIKTNDYVLTLGHSQALLNSIIDTYTLGNKLYLGFLGKETADAKVIVAALRVNLVSISEKLSQIQLLLGQIKLPFNYSDRLNNTDINQSINLLKSQITLALPLLDLVEKVGSNQSLQRYLIVIQDANELRPSGGFISTYGVLTLDQARIIDFQVDSSLSLDRLIEGKIDPPSIVKQLLNQTNWSFHDSNLDADYINSARQMSWFYQRFKNINLDGVIAMNSNFLRFVLEQIGAVTLADGQSINQDNLISLTSNPTSSKGLDIITALTQNLGTKLTSGEIPFAKLSRAFLKTVAFNEVNLWFSSPAMESLAESSNLAGVVKPQICHPQLSSLNCHADTIYLNESNMSVNKINYYLKRSQNLVAQISETGLVNYILNYDYSFPVPAPTDLGSIYKVYYQLYLPALSQNTTILLDAQPLDSKSLIQTDHRGLTKLEFSANLSLNQPHHLEIHFTSPNQLDYKKQLIPYTLAILKQPGTINDNIIFKVRYPINLVARNMTTPLKQNNANELTFQTSQTSQENIGIIFKNQAL